MRAVNLEEFLSVFVKKPNFNYVKEGRYYFYQNAVLKESLAKTSLRPFMKGLPLGFQGSFFQPSLFLLELLSKQTKNKVFVNPQAEWLFLCGRDVFLGSISRNESVGNLFLVQNELGENLGLGLKTKVNGKVMVRNLLDRGDFLRREK